MPTAVSLCASLLQAMLTFTADPKQFMSHSVLSELLLEITPTTLRLVATDSHVLGIMQFTSLDTMGVEIQSTTSMNVILPVTALAPLLKDNHSSPICLTIDDLHITVRTPSGEQMTVTGQSADQYPDYYRIIPTMTTKAIPGLSLDAALFARFLAFAHVMGIEPKLSIGFHSVTSPITVTFTTLTTFYGLMAPLTAVCSSNLPEWLTPPVTPRLIPLRVFDGFSGIDSAARTWAIFSCEVSDDHGLKACSICGSALTTGWLCLDNGITVCSAHMAIPVAALSA